jgi:hypothetical protein
MLRTAVLLTSLLLALPTGWSQWNGLGGAPKSRYPNEGSAFKFYEAASWRSLEPLVATMGDVRRVLGSPEEANDMSASHKTVPGR